MGTLRAILREILGLFVDDGSLALWLTAWCIGMAVILAVAPEIGGHLAATGLTIGCVAILVANVVGFARKRHAQRRGE